MEGQLSHRPLSTFKGQPQLDDGRSRDEALVARLHTVAWVCFAPKYQASGESMISISVSWRSWKIGSSTSNTFERPSPKLVTGQKSLLTVNRCQVQNMHHV